MLWFDKLATTERDTHFAKLFSKRQPSIVAGQQWQQYQQQPSVVVRIANSEDNRDVHVPNVAVVTVVLLPGVNVVKLFLRKPAEMSKNEKVHKMLKQCCFEAKVY